MAELQLFTLLQLLLTLLLQTSGFMSDYKTCGDDACARPMCRVQALRDQHAQDCRFLSFKKGDMIDVFHKLRQKRSDLWAGSIDKQFGYFPKDAVEVDEVFVDEKKEIEMRTQKTDFFCTDAFGTLIMSDEEFEDYKFGAQTGENKELGNSDFDDRVSKAPERNEIVETRQVDNNNKDRREAEQSGSSWIGSALSGWFANDANEEQVTFKSRKLALNLAQLVNEERQPRQATVLDWIGDGLSNTFGFGKDDLEAKSEDKTENSEDLPNEQIKNVFGDPLPSETKKPSQDENIKTLMEQQEPTKPKAEDLSETMSEKEKVGEEKDAGWYGSAFNRITNLYGDSSDKSEASKDKGKESLSDRGIGVDKVTISEEEKNPELRSESFLVQDSQSDRRTANREEKQDVIESGGDPPVTSESADVQPSREEKLEHLDHPAENMNKNNDAGWYSSVYSTISNMYGDPSDKNNVPDGMKDVESQTQSENTKDTSSASMFSMNGLSSVIDGLRSPSKAAGSDDEYKLSDSVTSEPNLMQSHASTDQSDAMTLKSDDDDDDDDDTEQSGLTEEENTDNRLDADQSPDTSQSIFSVSRLSVMINGLKSPFKTNNAGDQEENDEEKTPETGKEEQSDNDESSNDVELIVRSTDVVSERSSQRAALGSEEEEEEEIEEIEEEAVQDVNVAEIQISTVEGLLDCNKQDTSDDGENISSDISASGNDKHEDIDEFSYQSDHSKNVTSALNPDEAETLTQEPGWTEFSEHVPDTAKCHEGETNTHEVSEEAGFTDISGEEDPESESDTKSDSGLQVRTEVTENNSETVDESEEARDEGEAADVLPETEEAGMRMTSIEAGQSIHMTSNDEKQGVDDGGENKSVNITLMEYDEEREGGDIIKMEHRGKNGVDVTLTESGGEEEDVKGARMETDGEKEGEATQVEYSRGQEDQTESDGENKRIDVTQVAYSGGQDGVNTTHMESGGEVDGGVTQVEDAGVQEDGDVSQMESGGETEDSEAIQMETDGEKKTLTITQMQSGGEKQGEAPRVEYSGGKDGVDVAQMESDGEKESLNITPEEYAGGQDGVNNSQMESDGEKDGVVTQVEDAGGQEGVEIETFGEKAIVNGEKRGDITQVASDGEKEGANFIGLENTLSISASKQNLKPESDDSREAENCESTTVKQAEITPTNIRDKSPSTDGSETKTSRTSDEDRNEHVSENKGDKMMDIKHHNARRSAQTQKRAYPNLQAHLCEEDIQDLLKFFGEETLSWLDFIIKHSEYINDKELAELHDFEKTLEHHLKSRRKELKSSLQNIQSVLVMLRKTFIPVKADGSVDKTPDPSQTECVSEMCVNTTENTHISEQDTGKDDNVNDNVDNNMDDNVDDNTDDNMDENMDENMDDSSSINDSDSLISKSFSNDQEVVTEKRQKSDERDAPKSNQKTAPQPDTNIITEEFQEPEEPQNGVLHPYTVLTSDVFMYAMRESEHVKHTILEVVMSLPDDIRPGPDLYGLPWEAVIFTATLGLITFLLFTCRFIQAIKSRLYCSKERRMGQKVAELLEEKCKVLEMLSECEHKFKKLETALNGGVSAQDSEREDLEAMSKKLEEANAQMKSDMEKMQEDLDTQDQLKKQQEEQLTKLEEMLKKLEEEAVERKSQLQQDKTTLKIHEMNTERLQKKLQEAKEENSMLLESKAQLEQEAEGWKERLNELEEEKRMNETSHNGMMENCVNKDERIKSLTECLLKMRDWDSEEESALSDSSGSENKNSDFRQKQKVQKLINAAKMSADLKAMEEDKHRVFAKLTDEIKAKEDLQVSLEQLQCERESLESESSMYSSEIEKLQHKLQIMSEMYQEKELKLHRMLTVEEKERSEKEEQLNKAGKKISLATDELNSYRTRAKELEEELEKTNQAYRNQITAHEKKAHDNWLAARAADRDLADVKRENSVLRQRLTDWQFKLELMEKNPQARAPLFRGERSPFGPSPLGRPPSETRPFLSPPTLMDGPPRVSPQFPMMPGGRAPPGGVEGDRSVSYSEDGSPTWEREKERERERERRSLGPPGPDPGLVYRRPLSAPFLRAPLPPEAYYNEKSDSSFGAEGPGFRENGIRDSGRSMPGGDIRAGPLPPPPFPPMDPRDPHFPRRVYRPDFFPPPPPLAMRGPPPPLPPGVFPRIPLPPHMAFPPMRPSADQVSPEPPSRPSPPGSEQPPEQPPSAHDII